ncbi:NmrA family NAD(P)-binding protein [Chitinophaga filiformis]|uniref:NmrA family NAD(P)-binding protein n=1 Tax=Chitinophaga filiformis TaxID=104663 RepID=A0ABY4HU32_CHIFI|nr:NmrA family NAD(P)-binding protein [Chitinophaga filiformis]UPK67032.1 NmrA family NAD(P)-binding protein [Chitinophaga filiformis]
MFVITGVTGHVGRVTANLLLTQQQPVRAVVRNASKGTEWETKGAEVAVADLFDKASLLNAFKQAEGLFIMTPPALDLDDVIKKHLVMLGNIIAAIKETKPKKVVYLSSIGAHLEKGTGAIRKLYDMEQAFSQLDIPTAGIRAGWFMENFAGLIPGAIQSGNLMSFLCPTDLQVPMVAVNDIGKLAAELLNQHWAGHRIIELGGPCQYSADDVASSLSYYTNRSITAVPIPRSEYEPTYASFGFTADASRLMAEMNDGFNTQWIVFEGGTSEHVSGETLLEDALKTYIK